MHDAADGQAEKAVDLPHPLGVALGQVVVDGDDVHPLAGQGVEVGGQGRHQGLAFTGLHLGDLALVQHHAADQLDIEMAHAEHPLARLAHDGKGLGQQVVEGFPLLQTLPELHGLAAQGLVG